METWFQAISSGADANFEYNDNSSIVLKYEDSATKIDKFVCKCRIEKDGSFELCGAHEILGLYIESHGIPSKIETALPILANNPFFKLFLKKRDDHDKVGDRGATTVVRALSMMNLGFDPQ